VRRGAVALTGICRGVWRLASRSPEAPGGAGTAPSPHEGGGRSNFIMGPTSRMLLRRERECVNTKNALSDLFMWKFLSRMRVAAIARSPARPRAPGIRACSQQSKAIAGRPCCCCHI
jgi:hypothetical protein